MVNSPDAPRPNGAGINVTFCPGMRPAQIYSVLGACVLLFLLFPAPIWERYREPDASILWSYLPIPFLSGACLLWNRTFTFIHCLVSTICLTGVKYLITAAVLLTLILAHGPKNAGPNAQIPDWTTGGVNGDLHTMEGLRAEIELLDNIPPSVFGPRSLGGIVGTVFDKNGAPVKNAIVYCAGGLESYHFALETKSQSFTIAADGFLPRQAAARFYQPLRIAARDQQSHTTIASTERRGFLLNRPILNETTICFPRRALGAAKLPQYQKIDFSCGMHKNERGELYLFAHPFYTFSDESGNFKIDGLPAGRIAVGAGHPDLGGGESNVSVEPERETKVMLKIDKR